MNTAVPPNRTPQCPIFLSAVVCSYNRAKLLEKAIESLCNQTLEAKEFEIIVIDNASTDHTAELVQRLIDKHPNHQIRYFYEKEPGISHARNRGIHEARGAWIACLDDDAIAWPDWLAMGMAHIQSFDESTASLGGPYYPFFETERPKWFNSEWGMSTQGDENHFLPAGGGFNGSNMFVRKDVFIQLNGFNTKLGMTSGSMGLGEEPEFYQRLWESNYANEKLVFYAHDVGVDHLVPVSKLRYSYWIRRYWATGVTDYLLEKKCKSKPIRIMQGLLSPAYACRAFVKLFISNRSKSLYQNIALSFVVAVAELARGYSRLGFRINIAR